MQIYKVFSHPLHKKSGMHFGLQFGLHNFQQKHQVPGSWVLQIKKQTDVPNKQRLTWKCQSFPESMKVIINVTTSGRCTSMVVKFMMCVHLVGIWGTMTLSKHHPWPRRTPVTWNWRT